MSQSYVYAITPFLASGARPSMVFNFRIRLHPHPSPLPQGRGNFEVYQLKVKILYRVKPRLHKTLRSIPQSLPVCPFLAPGIFAENNWDELLLFGCPDGYFW